MNPPYPPLWAWCWLRYGRHEPYTHRHRDEPDVTYCIRCRTTLKGPA